MFYSEDGEVLEKVVRSGWCPISGGTEGQVGRNPVQPDLVIGDHSYVKGPGIGEVQDPLQCKPSCVQDITCLGSASYKIEPLMQEEQAQASS